MKIRIRKGFIIDRKILISVLIALLIRLIIAAFFFGPWDIESVYVVSDLLKKGSLVYNDTWRFNAPPVWLWIIGILTFVADKTGIPLYFLAKTPFMISDFGLAFILYKLGQIITKNKKTSLKIALFFLFSPITLWVSAYQGQLDSPLLLFILISAYFLLKNNKINWKHLICGGLALGLAGTFKFVSFGVLPIFLIYLFKKLLKEKESGLKILGKLGIFGVLGILPVILIFIPYLSVWETGIVPHVIGYKTAWGIWGTSFLLRRLGESGISPEIVSAVINFSKTQGLWIMILSLFSFAIVFFGKLNLVSSIFILFLTMTVFSPYFAIQYLLWVVPFWLLLRIDLKSFILYNFFVVASYFILVWEWTEPGIWVFLGNILKTNDRELFINLYSLPVFAGWAVVFLIWRKIIWAALDRGK